MALNYIWIFFFIAAFVIATCKLIFLGDVEVFNKLVGATTDMSKTAFDISLGLTGVICFWLGIMRIGEKGGALHYLAKAISPFFKRLFPEIPPEHPALGSIIMNYSANMLGLDNAATPLGLKAMKELQELNTDKEVASNSMIMFLTLNTAGFTIIPVSIIAFRSEAGAANPADIFLPLLIATYTTMISGLLLCAVWQKIKFDKVLLTWLACIVGALLGATFLFKTMGSSTLKLVTNVAGPLIIFSVISSFMILALYRKINVYDAFIEGAKEGFDVAIKIIPFLIAMLVGIGVFRAAGGLDMIIDGLGRALSFVGLDAQFVEALPVGLMKPFSGSGARGLMVETMKTNGADSLVSYMACLMNGSHDTTFYIIAVYFGSIAIKNTRYAIATGLITDLVSIVVSIALAYLFFG